MTEYTTGKKTTEGRESIDHPAHYNLHPAGIECIEIIAPLLTPIGTAVKHLHRAGLKGGKVMYVEDLSKAIVYTKFAIEYLDFPLVYPRSYRDEDLVRKYHQGFTGAIERALIYLLMHEQEKDRRDDEFRLVIEILEKEIQNWKEHNMRNGGYITLHTK